MRTTQEIGLTALGERIVFGCKQIESDTCACGMYDEQIPLRKWECPISICEYGRFIREKVQEIPWSSGPMIFLCLEMECNNKNKYDFAEWIHDPSVTCEYDKDSGRFWI